MKEERKTRSEALRTPRRLTSLATNAVYVVNTLSFAIRFARRSGWTNKKDHEQRPPKKLSYKNNNLPPPTATADDMDAIWLEGGKPTSDSNSTSTSTTSHTPKSGKKRKRMEWSAEQVRACEPEVLYRGPANPSIVCCRSMTRSLRASRSIRMLPLTRRGRL